MLELNGGEVTNQPAPVVDGGTAPDATQPETAEYVVSDKSKYKVPKDFKMPENLDKAFRSKEEHIQRLERELSSARMGAQSQQLIEKLEQLVTSGGKAEPIPKPDPVAEPEKYEAWILDRAGEQAANRATQASRDEHNRIEALKLSVELTKGDDPDAVTEKQRRLWEYLLQTGDAKVVGKDESGQPIVNVHPSRVRQAYRDLFYEDEIKAAKAQGLKEAQDAIGKAAGAPGSVPGQVPGATGVDYNSLTEEQQRAYRFEESKRTPPPGGKPVAP
jgi:hypothetical protein